MNKYLIIADDFTGANDTGVQLANVGIDMNVQFTIDTALNGSVVLDTETRNKDASQAEQILDKLLQTVDVSSYDDVIKKVDSTLRGNISIEMRFVAEQMNPDMVIFAPALPDAGRRITNNVLYVNDTPGLKTDFSKDPLKPIQTDDIHQLMQKAFPDQTIHSFDIQQIREHDFRLPVGSKYCTFDAQTDLDLTRVVKTVRATGRKVLWVGSSGLMNAILMQSLSIKPALALVGSVSEVTRRQLHIAEQNGIYLVSLPIDKIYKNSDYRTYVDEAVSQLHKGKDVVLMSSASFNRSDMAKTLTALQSNNVGLHQANVVIQAILSGVCRQVLRAVDVSGVFVSGGETAKGLLTISRATGAKVLTEIAPGIPLLKVTGGEFDGLHMVTKAGAFGDDHLIMYSFKKLKNQNHII